MRRLLHILHLEDEPHDSELMAATLRAEGVECDIVRVDTRDAFVRHLRDELVDVIISDVSVPGFDGITAQQVWQQERPKIPFIFLSGTFGEEVAIERLRAGATDYVLKHWVEKLPAVVRRALREYQERTGHQQAQDDLEKLAAELERRVEERTAQLAAAKEAMKLAKKEAERANRAKSDFLSRMSHDLRTPLNAVLGFAQLLDMDNLTTDQRESVLQILEAGRHLLGLMNEVLDISRIEAGHLSLSPEPVSVSDTIEQAVKLVRPLATPRRIEIDVLPQNGADRHVQADRQRLNQILLNLVSNAIKYNRAGGRVTLSSSDTPDGRVRINVTDTGAGIRPEKLDLLFKPFERLGADQTGIEGTGLGLALSRGLAEAMDGIVGVESTVDVGSTFWVELAGATAPDSAARVHAAPDHVEPQHAATGTVLYIEDNASNVRLVERVMGQRRPGITLLTANDGETGIAVALEKHPGLIFLDLHLPDTPGEEVLRRLWADPRTRQIPVAVLSADATSNQSRRLLAAGATAYLTKPLDVSKLLALLDERFHS
jgi:signal transduction histidine kinase/ActR/RegA family two-component response regulator